MHPKEVKPVYRPDGDNRMIVCFNLTGVKGVIYNELTEEVKGVTYEELLPDGTLIPCYPFRINEEWKKKQAVKFEQILIDYWAWVTDIIPI